MTFREVLLNCREDKGMTQSALARKVGVKQCTISGYESGRFSPQVDIRFRLAEALDVEPIVMFPELEEDDTQT